ncbi:unnamed protein product [Brassica napus]|uniref:ADP-ribosyl cyclase/cyclic ADP-ribose hydrolase n=1 Tax=Brassica napus TaxID=3708 RepID=A0A816XWJ3_BRANA|nr:unnamed protein product [Brassica napus]
MDSAASPSSLPSSVSHNWEYRVFPSFCEEEISRGFFGYFKKEFERKGIKLFIDRRESFGPGLIEAIRRSRIAIVILSKHYASSTLRLDELVEIMKCREELGAADVKKQSGYFGSVFEKACVGRSVEDVEKWKRALNELSFIFGYLSGNWKSEDDMMEEVANNLSNMLNKAAPSTDFDGFVGMENHITQISSLLSLDFVDDVRMVGIWGPAGIGKTTVARALYWKLSNNFEVTDFMESIRGSPENHHPFVLNLQEQYRKVLLVLDDVHDSKQLKAMAGNPQWFGRGSRIIITTNDKKLLKAHGIDQIYHVEFPSTLEALEIFCLYAFDQKSPYDGFEELSMEITGLAGNLPLGLSVFGSYLRGMSKGEWMHALPRLRTSLDANTEKALRCDYETLCDKEKALFLHIACFFKGERTSNLGEYFSNLDIRRGLQVLAEKSLISIDNGARLVMHNLLELLGLEISRKEYIDENRRRAREIGDVLADDTGYVSARGTDHVLTAIKDEISIDERANERTLDSLPALSPLPSNCTHHVFASFRGVDVRKSFLRHMLMVLRNKGITLFTDIEIETGTSIVHELKEAIHRSRISIILISNKSVEDVEKWKRALDEVSNIFRYVSRSWEMEEIIEKVANNLSDLLYEDVPSGDFDGLVGMENHIMQISSLLSLDSDDVRMVGIWGPSGIGKTTTARALYRKLSSNFTHTAFMESIKAIREEIHTDDHAYMLYLQEKLLCQTFNHMGLEIHHLGVAEKRLKDKKVLVVLDDVDDLKQLKAMAKKTQWFGNGSRIIITTTDKKLLKAHGINDIYHVEFPCASDALEILCLHAFGQKSPYLGFEELAMDVTQLAGDLPLGLSVFGSYLRGRSEEEWTAALPRFRTSLVPELKDILRCDYEALWDKDKYLFLHIACFFNGKKTTNMVKHLSNLDVTHGLQILTEKSLISIDKDGRLVMHSLLEQLGKEIAHKEYRDEYGRCKFVVDAGELGDSIEGSTYKGIEFKNKGITVFTDNNDIKRSMSIGPELKEAIKGSRVSIVIVSKNYASSTWCLDELVLIMKCREELGQIVMTMFYDVEPTDVKKQTGYFGSVFESTCVGKSVEDVERWKQALKEVATIAGFDSTICFDLSLVRKNEAEMIENVATDISNKLNMATASRDFDGLVGMENHITQISSMLSLDSNDVRMVGILGPAGIGKTTIARALYNKLSNSFTHTAFMESIRGTAKSHGWQFSVVWLRKQDYHDDKGCTSFRSTWY